MQARPSFPDLDLDAWRRLGCAILLQAVKDAKDGNGEAAEARRWLAGGGARWLVGALDLDPAGLALVLAGLPRPAAVQLTLPGWWDGAQLGAWVRGSHSLGLASPRPRG